MLIIVCLTLVLCMMVACNETPDTGNSNGGGNTGGGGGNSGDGGNTGEEWTLDKEDGYNQLTIYWKGNADLETTDVWIWWDGKEGSGYLMHECSYGMKTMVNVPEGIDKVGFIVRKNCSDPGGNSWGDATKDYDQDRWAILEGESTVIYLKSGDANQYVSNDNGVTLEMIKKFSIASIINLDTIYYNVTPATKLQSLDDVKLYADGNEVEIAELDSIGSNTVAGRLRLQGGVDITKQYELEIKGYGKKVVVPMGIFDTPEFIEQYTYDGDDLGAIVSGGKTTFKLWAPTASKVVLNLFDSGHEGTAYKSVDLQRADKGVWERVEDESLYGKYYTYTVTTCNGTQEAVDPYAKSAGANGNRGMIIDLDATDPQGFENDNFVQTIDNYTDAIIWEVHVRDFSNKIETSQYKGKYKAFTETGLTNSHGIPVGVDYVKNLGITHVHLLPVYDYATVDETNPNASFNWGYDPKNYNVPEGSYSSNPYDGNVRVNEFKLMVQGLHNQGIGVIMDMVYNHTYDGNSSLNKIVPYYYYRYTSDGANSSGSGCGNDTASERKMFRKFMVDSVSYWVSEYHLDGLRFDLMGLHDINTMKAIEEAVHAINPKAIIYGEGWTMGDNRYTKENAADQSHIDEITPTNNAAGAIAVFNDAIRDGLKGSVFESAGQGYINGLSNYDNYLKVAFGVAGSAEAKGAVTWDVDLAGSINYMSAHDNNTLWDKLAISNADNTVEERLAMNRLGAAINFFSLGTPFMQAGEEMLRTKYDETTGTYDHNSYKSSDAINNIDWEKLTLDSDEYAMMNYYKGLIALRKQFAAVRSNDTSVVSIAQLSGYGMAITFQENATSKKVLVLVNPKADSLVYGLNGNWDMYAEGAVAGTEVIGEKSGDYTLAGRSVSVFVSK